MPRFIEVIFAAVASPGATGAALGRQCRMRTDVESEGKTEKSKDHSLSRS